MRTHRVLHDLARALRFLTRLPLPALAQEDQPFAAPALSRIAYAIPLAGALVGLVGALALLLAHALGFPPFLTSVLALAALVLATGAFHEDGLADTADGFGGGRDVASRLAIMRDSRIGTYGASALILSLLLRLGAIEALLVWAGPVRCTLALIAAGAVSRAAGLLLLQSLPAARSDGIGVGVGAPGPDAAARAALMGALIVALIVIPAFGVGATFAGLIAPAAAWLAIHRLARRLIGGQTGDVAGAVQQLAEIAFLLAVFIFARGP
ncbi:adenosylcobinamide-GDP ribazoletransferase [Aquabacter spiritensis]|uniref:Adenosylcobinamide-GDP ribazoletransferase n=1 Tax=Aquabacter spiritensis TaxID=933073 RepID=A0A4R3M0I5_9HYPH|nr:adenosylcobinamide-GDP ribazoletransferase [Aquabacter spiritensis]TCT04595.1 cobalamin-5'-phosphate synthase [Aquabacter spiritensis]